MSFLQNTRSLIYRNIISATDIKSVFWELSFFPIIQIFVVGYSIASLSNYIDISIGNTAISYPLYLTTGMIAINGMVMSTLVGAIIWNDRRNGMLEQILVMPFTRTDYILSNISTVLILSFVSACIIFLAAIPILYGSIHISITATLYIITALVLNSLFFSSIVIIGSTLFEHREKFTIFINIISYVGVFMSTAQYPFIGVHPIIQSIFMLNPLTYVVNIIRDSMFSEITFFTNVEVALLGGISIVSLIFAMVAFKKIKM